MSCRPARAAAALLVALVAGCGGSGNNVGAPSPTSTTAAPTPTATPTVFTSAPIPSATCTPPPFTANTAPDTQAPSGGFLGMQSASAALQTCYDRVVFTLGGSTTAQPGWVVEYVTTPTSDGSGNAVTVAGPSYLQVVIKDVGLPGDTGVADPAVKRFSPGTTQVVREVVLDTVFEGHYTAFIGLTATLPFKVFRLSNPARVVVDIRHS